MNLKCTRVLIIQELTENLNNKYLSGRESFLPDFFMNITRYLDITKLTITISRYLPIEYMNHIYKYFLITRQII